MKENYFRKSFIWGFLSKITDAFVKFFTVPLLLKEYGVSDFGVLTLVLSTNAYLQLLELGVNTGAIKYFSEWIHSGKKSLLTSVANTSFTFYLILGAVNALILFILSMLGQTLFGLDTSLNNVYSTLMLILACFTIFSWLGSVLNQLQIANEKIALINIIGTIKSLLLALFVFAVVNFHLTLKTYFLGFMMLNASVIIPHYFLITKQRVLNRIRFGNDWTQFRRVLKYSMAIFAMGIFQFVANKSRPLILALGGDTDASILTEYRILEVFPLFIISVGGMMISILLPRATQVLSQGDPTKIQGLAYQGTLYSSILVLVMCMPVLLNSAEIIDVYVGKSYTYLSVWLQLWVLTIIIFLHNGPVASLVLASGKTKLLVISSAMSCMVSLIINFSTKNDLGVGSAVFGYFVYIIIQMTFYYFYFNTKVLSLNSLEVFKRFALPLLFSSIALAIVYILNLSFDNLFIQILVKSLVWFVVFAMFLVLFQVISVKKILSLIKN